MELVASGFSIFGLTIEYYGIFMALGMLAGMLVAMRLCKHRGMDSNAIFTLAIFTLPSALIGARLYYVIFDQEVWSLKQILFTRGGFAVYGGIIGGVLAVIIYCLIKKVSIVKMFDILAPALIIGQFIGRIGCYFGGCCYGQLVINQALQWFPLSLPNYL